QSDQLYIAANLRHPFAKPHDTVTIHSRNLNISRSKVNVLYTQRHCAGQVVADFVASDSSGIRHQRFISKLSINIICVKQVEELCAEYSIDWQTCGAKHD